MEAYNNFQSAHQLHGSKNAPIGILLCNHQPNSGAPLMILHLPNGVKILNPGKSENDKEVAIIDPNSKIY